MKTSYYPAAYSMLRYIKIEKFMVDLNRTYVNQNYDFMIYYNFKDLLRKHPIVRKPISEYMIVIQISSEWFIVFDDKINTDGCASLMYNLNRLFFYEGLTIDEGGGTLPGTMLTYYRGKKSRVIQSYLDCNRWVFFTEGEPLEFENLSYYKNRIIKRRFNRTILNEYFEKLNIPSVEKIQELINQPRSIYCIRRSSLSGSLLSK
jgi:hypothetical protein